MLYEGTIDVAASPAEAMTLFMDVPRIASLIPGAAIDGLDDDGAYRGTMVVVFGPKRIKFNGKVAVAFDLAAKTGTMLGHGTGNVRGANVESKMSFGVAEANAAIGGPPASVVSIRADIALGGVLAEFARTGGPVVANALLKEFSNRLAAELATTECSRPAVSTSVGPADKTTPVLRSERIVWVLVTEYIKARVRELRRKFHLPRR